MEELLNIIYKSLTNLVDTLYVKYHTFFSNLGFDENKSKIFILCGIAAVS